MVAVLTALGGLELSKIPRVYRESARRNGNAHRIVAQAGGQACDAIVQPAGRKSRAT